MTGVFRSREKIQGLTDFLSGQSQLDQVLYTTDFPNLDIIESGQSSAQPNRSFAKQELYDDDGSPA